MPSVNQIEIEAKNQSEVGLKASLWTPVLTQFDQK